MPTPGNREDRAVPAHEFAPEDALLPDRRVSCADEQPGAADDDLTLFDHCARVRRHQIAVDPRAITRAEVPHADTAVLQQRQQRMPGRRMLVVHDDFAAEVTAHAALGAGALEALPQDPVPMRVDLLDQHHGVQRRAPR